MVRDESMLPSLQPGDRLLVDPRAYRERPPAPGDVVVLVDPADPARWLVKRVAAVGPGRFWTTRAGTIVDGGPADAAPPPSDSVERLTLPDGTVYVTGDARDHTRDSRHFGPVSTSSLVGRAYRCYGPPARRREL